MDSQSQQIDRLWKIIFGLAVHVYISKKLISFSLKPRKHHFFLICYTASDCLTSLILQPEYPELQMQNHQGRKIRSGHLLRDVLGWEDIMSPVYEQNNFYHCLSFFFWWKGHWVKLTSNKEIIINYHHHLFLSTTKVHRAEASQVSERPLNVTKFFKPQALYMSMFKIKKLLCETTL